MPTNTPEEIARGVCGCGGDGSGLYDGQDCLCESITDALQSYGDERAREMRERAASVASGSCECYMGESCPFCDVAAAIRALPEEAPDE